MGLFHHSTTTDLGSAATATSAATGTVAAAASSPTATLIDGLTCGNYGMFASSQMLAVCALIDSITQALPTQSLAL